MEYIMVSGKDVAMVEHNIISENDILEWSAEHLQWYLAGVNDFAEKLIEKIREREVDS